MYIVIIIVGVKKFKRMVRNFVGLMVMFSDSVSIGLPKIVLGFLYSIGIALLLPSIDSLQFTTRAR